MTHDDSSPANLQTSLCRLGGLGTPTLRSSASLGPRPWAALTTKAQHPGPLHPSATEPLVHQDTMNQHRRPHSRHRALTKQDVLLGNILAALEAHRAWGLEQKALPSTSHDSPAQSVPEHRLGGGGGGGAGTGQCWALGAGSRAHGLCPPLLPKSRVQQGLRPLACTAGVGRASAETSGGSHPSLRLCKPLRGPAPRLGTKEVSPARAPVAGTVGA